MSDQPHEPGTNPTERFPAVDPPPERRDPTAEQPVVHAELEPDPPTPPPNEPTGTRLADRLDTLVEGDPRQPVAAALVVATLTMLFGALLVGAAWDGGGAGDEWKVTIKIIGLSTGLGLPGGALIAAVALVAALVLSRDAPDSAVLSFTRIGAMVAGLWLSLFTFLGIIVDLTNLGDEFVAVFGTLVANLGLLALLVIIALWSLTLVRSRRPA